jgi:hypothetical protein
MSQRSFIEVNRVPQGDGSGGQGEPAGAILLLLEAAVADFAKAVEEYSSGERIAGFILVQACVHTPSQLNALQPIQDEQCALDTTEFA